MGRADTRTLLPLDRWSYHLGMDPRHFNGLETSLRPARLCHQPTLQYAWQDSDRVGRDDIAQAIAQAESEVVEALGYFPVPQWIAGEVVRVPETRSLYPLMDPHGRYPSIDAAFGMLISGGMRAETDLGTPALAWSDPDTDGYDEIATVVAATVATDINEIRCYFPGQGGEDTWEIRPLRSVVIAGGNVTVQIDRHLLVDPDLWEALDASGINGDVDANFIATVNMRRVYNDPSQQAQLQWERIPGTCNCGDSTCAQCAWSTQWACLQSRDPRLGEFTYQPGDWNAVTEEFDAAVLAVNRRPERVRIWYRAGYESPRTARPMVEMDPALERIIVLYSATLLDRGLCTCNNVVEFMKRWTEDRALVAADGSRYQFQTGQDPNLTSPWGTTAGALWAWKQTSKFALGRAVKW